MGTRATNSYLPRLGKLPIVSATIHRPRIPALLSLSSPPYLQDLGGHPIGRPLDTLNAGIAGASEPLRRITRRRPIVVPEGPVHVTRQVRSRPGP